MFDPTADRSRHQATVEYIRDARIRRGRVLHLQAFELGDGAPCRMFAFQPMSDQSAGRWAEKACGQIGISNEPAIALARRFLLTAPGRDCSTTSRGEIAVAFFAARITGLERRVPPFPRSDVYGRQRLAAVIERASEPAAACYSRFDRDHIEYRPHIAGVAGLSRTQFLRHCLNRGQPTIPCVWLTKAAWHHGNLNASTILVNGWRELYARTKPSPNQMIAKHWCEFMAKLRRPHRTSDDRCILRLVPPAFVDPTTSAHTHPVASVYYVLRSGRTVTKFAFFHRSSGALLSVGHIGSSQICPYVHPKECLDVAEEYAKTLD